jgi:hypothetical protein
MVVKKSAKNIALRQKQWIKKELRLDILQNIVVILSMVSDWNDRYGNDVTSSFKRVETWASTWIIGQFQPVDGPTVTV